MTSIVIDPALTEREQLCDDLIRLSVFLREHTNVPVRTYVLMTANADDDDTMQAIADQLGAPVERYERGSTIRIDIGRIRYAVSHVIPAGPNPAPEHTDKPADIAFDAARDEWEAGRG